MPEDVNSGGFYIWGIPTIIRSGRPQCGFAVLAPVLSLFVTFWAVVTYIEQFIPGK